MTDELTADEYNAIAKRQKRSKYGNRFTERDGVVFHSQAEADRYGQLKIMQDGGAIADLVLQPPYPVVINGKRICTYIADFVYRDSESGQYVVEDVKGGKSTPEFRLKAKLVEALYGVKIREVRMR